MKKFIVTIVITMFAVAAFGHHHRGGFHRPPPPPPHHCGWWRPPVPRPAHCYAEYWGGYVAPATTVVTPSTVTYHAPLRTRQYYVTASGTIGQSVEAAAFSGAAGGYAGVTTVVEPAAAPVTVPTRTWVSPGWQYAPDGSRYFTPGHFVPRW